MTEITTYRDLLVALQSLSPGQLDQDVQLAKPTVWGGVALKPAIAVGTVGDMEFERCRSSVDNRYHADEIVILYDGNPFGKDGAIAYQMNGKTLDDMTPIYGADGPTDKKDQMPPASPSDFPANVGAACRYRMRKIDGKEK